MVDSGTTLTMLPAAMYTRIIKEFDLSMGRNYKRAGEVEQEMGMGLCYYLDDEKEKRASAPAIALHFVGNASVVLPKRNYLFEFERKEGQQQKNRKVGCLMVMNGGDDDEGGPAATLGNYQQQGFEVVYDLEQRRVGFARRRCAELWDTLSRGS